MPHEQPYVEMFERYEQLKKMAWSGDPRCPTDAERKELADLVAPVRDLKEFLGMPVEWWNT